MQNYNNTNTTTSTINADILTINKFQNKTEYNNKIMNTLKS